MLCEKKTNRLFQRRLTPAEEERKEAIFDSNLSCSWHLLLGSSDSQSLTSQQEGAQGKRKVVVAANNASKTLEMLVGGHQSWEFNRYMQKMGKVLRDVKLRQMQKRNISMYKTSTQPSKEEHKQESSKTEQKRPSDQTHQNLGCEEEEKKTPVVTRSSSSSPPPRESFSFFSRPEEIISSNQELICSTCNRN